MALRIDWTETAISCLNDIINYIESRFGELATQKFVRTVYLILDQISIFLVLGKLEKSKNNFRTIIIEKKQHYINLNENITKI